MEEQTTKKKINEKTKPQTLDLHFSVCMCVMYTTINSYYVSMKEDTLQFIEACVFALGFALWLLDLLALQCTSRFLKH